MPRKLKPIKRKATTRQGGSQKRRSKRHKILIGYLWKSIVVFSVLLGIFASFSALSVDISVVPDQSFNPDDPIATPFVITNEGPLPIHSVEFFWYVQPMGNEQLKLDRLSLTNPSISVPVMNRKEQKTYFCPPIFKWQDTFEADILIRVIYRPDFLLWRQEKDFRFVAKRDVNGIPRWIRKPVSENP